MRDLRCKNWLHPRLLHLRRAKYVPRRTHGPAWLALQQPATARRAPATTARPRLDDGVTVRFKVNAGPWLKPRADHGLTVEATPKLAIVRSEIGVGENPFPAYLAGPEHELGISDDRCGHARRKVECLAREIQRTAVAAVTHWPLLGGLADGAHIGKRGAGPFTRAGGSRCAEARRAPAHNAWLANRCGGNADSTRNVPRW